MPAAPGGADATAGGWRLQLVDTETRRSAGATGTAAARRTRSILVASRDDERPYVRTAARVSACRYLWAMDQ